MDTRPHIARRRILIVRLSSLGDIVHVWPVSHALRSRYPQAEITWLTRERYRALLEMNPCLDEILVLKERRIWDVVGRLRDVFQTIRIIRRQQYDVVLDLHAVLMSHWIVWLSGAPLKLGLDKRNDLGFRLFRYRRLPKDRKIHRVRLYLEPLEFLGIGPSDAVFPFLIPAAAHRSIDEFFQDRGLAAADLVVTIHPGTAVAIKRWSRERFQELAAKLARQPGVRIVLVSGDLEKAGTRPIDTGGAIIHAPPLSLQELAELCRRSDVVIGNDSGPLQLAAALGRPTVAIFGPSDPQISGPYGSQHLIIRDDLPCSPCYGTFKIYFFCKRLTNACIKKLAVERVFQEIVQYLSHVQRHKTPAAAPNSSRS